MPNDDFFDFGFTAVTEDELEVVTKKTTEVASAKEAAETLSLIHI